MTIRTALLIRTLIACSLAVHAHCEAASKGGTIEGHVFCKDTRSPARLAKVLLIPLESGKLAAQPGSLPGAVTDMDGAFRIDDVPVGDYFVYAVLPGYLDASRHLANDLLADQSQLSENHSVPIVHVLTAHTSGSTLSLDRGSAIAGQMTYSDGSPVQGATVTVLKQSLLQIGRPEIVTSLSPYLFDNVGSITDDLGRFRIVGLESGDYSLRATITSPKSLKYTGGLESVEDSGNQFNLTIFLGNTLHWKEASTIHLGSTEERQGVDMQIPFQTLHSVAGTVQSALDRHNVTTGLVSITSVDDTNLTRKVRIEDGQFEFDLVPPGAYVLEVTGTKDVIVRTTRIGNHQLNLADIERRFKSSKSNIEVMNQDVTDLIITVNPEH